MKTIKTETWLPVFPGFYNTIFDSENAENIVLEDSDEGKTLTWDAVEWDYKEYIQRVSRAACLVVSEELKRLGFITSYEYAGIDSPREYNFRNDYVEVNYEITAENQVNIAAYLNKNRKAWAKYLEDKFTSCSGFHSFHSNDPKNEDWKMPEVFENGTRCGSILDFILQNEEYDMESLWDEIYEDCQQIEYTI